MPNPVNVAARPASSSWVVKNECVALLVPVAMAGVLFCKAFAVPAPIFSSDEYSYWRNAVMLQDRAALHEADPRIQRIDNKGYCALLLAWHRLAPDSLMPACLMNTAAWFAMVALVFATARILVPRRDAALAAAVASTMPSGLTAGTLMADTVYGLGYWLILFTIVCQAGKASPWRETVIVSALLAGMVAVKPHAIVLVGAYLLFVLMRSVLHLRGDVRGTIRRYAPALCLGMLAFGGVHSAIEGLEPAASATATAGFGAAYNEFLDRALQPDLLRGPAVGKLLWDLLAHCSLLLLFFALPATYLLLSMWPDRLGAPRLLPRLSPPQAAFCRFLVLSTALLVTMTVVFTDIAGRTQDQAGRIHERYYWFILPGLIVTGCMANRCPTSMPLAGRIAAVVALVTVPLYQIAIGPTLRLYPFDAPDLFGLYRTGNAYWNHPCRIPHGELVVVTLAAVAALIGLRRPRLAWACAVAALWANFALGWLTTLDWQKTVSGDHHHRLADTRTLGTLVGRNRVQAICKTPYGPSTANLFGLDGNPLVRVAEDAVIESADIVPEAEAVFVEGSHDFRHPYAWKVAGSSGTMYSLGDRGGFAVARAPVDAGQAFDAVLCRFGDTTRNVALFGFNEPEGWGAWSARSNAEIVLPRTVQGRAKVTLQGFVSAEIAASAVTLCIGEATVSLDVGTTLAAHVAECDIGPPTDRVRIVSKIHQPQPWVRPLGVAIVQLAIEKIPEPSP